MYNPTDEELIQKYKAERDENSLEVLVKRYTNLIYGFVYRYVGNGDAASDVTQEVFVKVWRNLNKFDWTRNFKPWIFTIAKNTAIDWLKKKGALPFSLIEERRPDFLENIKDDSALVAFERNLLQKDFALALGRLPSSYNSVIKLRAYEGFSFREISESLQEPLNTVKSRYRRGLVLLKGLMEKPK